MKGTVVAFDQYLGHGAAARVVDGQLDDLLIDPPETRIRPGAIYRAKVGRPMKGQGGAILDTPDGPLFLRQAKGLGVGETVIVQTSTYAERGKATPATLKLLVKSRYCLISPGAPGLNISRSIKDEERRVVLREMTSGLVPEDGQIGVVLRTATETADDDDVRSDVAQALDLAQAVLSESHSGAPELLFDGLDAAELAMRDWPIPDVTDVEPGSFQRHGIDDMIDQVRRAHVPLDGGGAMYVEPTRALVSVDVNTAGDTSPAAGLKANISALRELPRALRLRGLGGQIVIDFAPLPKGQRRQVENVLRAALRTDPIETSFVGWTPLGHMELQRKRERLPLYESLS